MTTEILIYGEIGFDVTAQYVAAELAAADGEDVHVRFNTPGGIGSEGIAIYNRLREYAGHVKGSIDGACASAGMIAACGCDELEMAANAFAMVHNSWVGIEGNADDLEQNIKGLRRFDQHQANIYAERTGLSIEKITALMKRENELDAQEALSLGFIDAITGESRIAANLNKDKIMARATTKKKPAAKKAATPKRTVKKPAAKKARTRSVSVELEEDEDLAEDDDLLSEDEDLAEDDDLLSEDEELAEDDDLLSEDDELAEDDEEEMAEDDEPTVKSASYRQILKACSGINPKSSADAKFLTRVQSKGLSLGQAKSAWMRELRARIDRNAGVEPIRSSTTRKPGGSTGGTAVARFNAAVRERMKLVKCSRSEAAILVAKSNKDLHKAYLLETNPSRQKREMINDRFRR